tara:strand:+ start:437 stop:679 length:243 start_codon:yes stop_codon:yes gene_type:complete
MAGEPISVGQIQKILNRVSVDIAGFKDKQGTTVVSGYVEYRQPITKRLDAVIGAAAYQASGEWGDVEGVPFKQIKFEYNF